LRARIGVFSGRKGGARAKIRCASMEMPWATGGRAAPAGWEPRVEEESEEESTTSWVLFEGQRARERARASGGLPEGSASGARARPRSETGPGPVLTQRARACLRRRRGRRVRVALDLVVWRVASDLPTTPRPGRGCCAAPFRRVERGVWSPHTTTGWRGARGHTKCTRTPRFAREHHVALLTLCALLPLLLLLLCGL
jgi:hypothetical protein